MNVDLPTIPILFFKYIGRQFQLDRQPSDTERVQATLETIGISMNYQLRSLIEWAKDLKGFVELSDNDKVLMSLIPLYDFYVKSSRLLCYVVIRAKISS